MPRKGVGKGKKKQAVKAENAYNEIINAENNVDPCSPEEEDVKMNSKVANGVSKKDTKKVENGKEELDVDDIAISSEVNSKSPVKQKKKTSAKIKDSEKSNENENGVEAEHSAESVEKKPVLGKRGRKKVDIVGSQSKGSECLDENAEEPISKQKKNIKKDIPSSLGKNPKFTEAVEGNSIHDKNEKKGLKSVVGAQQTEEKIENEEIIPVKKGGRERKNKAVKHEEMDKEIEESESVPSDNFNESNVKEARVLIKRNKQAEKAVETSKKLSSDETSARGRRKNVDVQSDVGESTKGKKRKQDDGDNSKPKPKAAKESAKSKTSSKKEKISDVTALDFSNNSTAPNGKNWNFKLASWNVNGVRAWLEKDGISYLHHEKPDILCIQETKCSDDKLPEEVKSIDGYHTYWLAGDKDGYSGVGLIAKEKPIDIKFGIGVKEHDNEGRVITAEFDQFYLVAVYVPNAGRGLVRLEYRMQWDKDFRSYLKKLDNKKPVILCGDLNVAHEEIDLANPKTNKKNAGFTKEEREAFSSLLSEGFIDTFRHLYPDAKDAYTFWTYMMNARAKNVGWRLDYFVVSQRFAENVSDSVIRKDVQGSDHCPVALFLSV